MHKIKKNKVINKPWGKEEIIFLSDDYCVKKLIMKKGELIVQKR